MQKLGGAPCCVNPLTSFSSRLSAISFKTLHIYSQYRKITLVLDINPTNTAMTTINRGVWTSAYVFVIRGIGVICVEFKTN